RRRRNRGSPQRCAPPTAEATKPREPWNRRQGIIGAAVEDVLRVRAVVRGQVQMVGFRAFVLHHANRLSLGGSVRNRSDGSVECVVEGPRGAVSALLEY